jgi:2',3'-cyclic-nucleotide 2'-phosphodiesterase
MRILFLGDIVGRSGREALARHLPGLRARLAPDLVVANGENAAHGRGITPRICAELFALGVGCITTGNHVWDQREIVPYIAGEPRLLRPANAPPGTPGAGVWRGALPDGRAVAVACLMGRLFMEALDDPFAAGRALADAHPLGHGGAGAVLVDFHGEASSEKAALAHHLDGRVSAVVGTHTHVPTADARVLPGGSAFLTDAGMCGDYDSIIGARTDIAMHRFVRGMPHAQRMTPASGPGAVAGALIVTDDASGLARAIEPVRAGPGLPGAMPNGV